MANDNNDGGGKPPDKKKSGQGDFGALTGGEDDALGNLPPLSAFESGSGAGFDSDVSLPPLGNLDSDRGAPSGLPPIEELTLEEPIPTGGAVKPSPPGYEGAGGVSKTSSGGFETPLAKRSEAEPPSVMEGTGFQDLSADSHFPQVGADLSPGVESDLDTPMFDSALSGDVGAISRATPARPMPAPTQAMDTPLFETPADSSSASGGFGFDDGAFGGESAEGGGGTPMPDFSPDTGLQAAMAPASSASEIKKVKKKRRGGLGIFGTVGVGLAGAVIGIIAGPFIADRVEQLPSPTRTKWQDTQKELDAAKQRLANITKSEIPGAKGLTPEDIDELIRQRDELLQANTTLTTQHDDLAAKCDQLRKDLAMIEADIESKNEEYIDAQESYEELANQKSIVEARYQGLLAEVGRLTDRVGQLEDADARRLATKETLLHDVNRLSISVKEGLPLTPEKYSYQARLAAVEDLKAKVDAAKWVSPALLDAYSSLYQKEMEIAATKSYFFACLPVTDRLGAKYTKWSECLMVGNWGVYYRSLDGKNIGVYENVATPGLPAQYVFREDLDEVQKKEIEARVFEARTEGFEEKVKMLAERQLIQQGESGFQRAFDSMQ